MVVSKLSIVCLCLVAAASLPHGPAMASLVRIAATDESVPNGNGTFLEFHSGGPIVNEAGQVAFTAELANTAGGTTDNKAIFLGDGSTLVELVRKGQLAPDGNGKFSDFGPTLALNNNGEVAFKAELIGTAGGALDHEGIFVGTAGEIAQVIRGGDALPDGSGIFLIFDTSDINFSDTGNIAFVATLVGTPGGSADDLAIFRTAPLGIVEIARRGQAIPTSEETFYSFGQLAMNESGEVAFEAVFGYFARGVFRGSGGSITQIARTGDPQPGAAASFTSFVDNSISIGPTGVVNFVVQCSPSGGINVYQGTGGALLPVAVRGDPAPSGNGVLDQTYSPSPMNASGMVASRWLLADTYLGALDNVVILTSDGTSMTELVRESTLAPDGNGWFSNLFERGINDAGVVVVEAEFAGTLGGTADDRGIYIVSDSDLFKVVREGQEIEGKILKSFDTLSHPRRLGQVTINNNEEVPFDAEFAYQGEAIYLFTLVPEPALVLMQLAAIGTVVVLRWSKSMGVPTREVA